MQEKPNTLSKVIDGPCPYCYSNLAFNLAERRGDVQIVCPVCNEEFPIKKVEKFLQDLSPNLEGKCPNCFAELEFSIENRADKGLLICPVCKDEFYMSEVGPTKVEDTVSHKIENKSPSKVVHKASSKDEETNIFALFKKEIPKFADFHGRATKREYWSFLFVSLLLSIGLPFLILPLLFLITEEFLSLLFLLSVLFFFLSAISISVRRLHDTGRPGHFLLLFFLPLVGHIVLLTFLLEDSQQEDNEYGPYIG